MQALTLGAPPHQTRYIQESQMPWAILCFRNLPSHVLCHRKHLQTPCYRARPLAFKKQIIRAY